MSERELQLRTSRHFRELAEEIAHLLWNTLSSSVDIPRMDPHRFPRLSLAINAVLLRHIGECQSCACPVSCDPWARTGGGAPLPAECFPVCQDHVERIRKEVGPQIDKLILELEMEIYGFLTRYRTRPLLPVLVEEVHRIVHNEVGPLLIKNLASSCCDECTRVTSQSKC